MLLHLMHREWWWVVKWGILTGTTNSGSNTILFDSHYLFWPNLGVSSIEKMFSSVCFNPQITYAEPFDWPCILNFIIWKRLFQKAPKAVKAEDNSFVGQQYWVYGLYQCILILWRIFNNLFTRKQFKSEWPWHRFLFYLKRYVDSINIRS